MALAEALQSVRAACDACRIAVTDIATVPVLRTALSGVTTLALRLDEVLMNSSRAEDVWSARKEISVALLDMQRVYERVSDLLTARGATSTSTAKRLLGEAERIGTAAGELGQRMVAAVEFYELAHQSIPGIVAALAQRPIAVRALHQSTAVLRQRVDIWLESAQSLFYEESIWIASQAATLEVDVASLASPQIPPPTERRAWDSPATGTKPRRPALALLRGARVRQSSALKEYHPSPLKLLGASDNYEKENSLSSLRHSLSRISLTTRIRPPTRIDLVNITRASLILISPPEIEILRLSSSHIKPPTPVLIPTRVSSRIRSNPKQVRRTPSNYESRVQPPSVSRASSYSHETVNTLPTPLRSANSLNARKTGKWSLNSVPGPIFAPPSYLSSPGPLDEIDTPLPVRRARPMRTVMYTPIRE